MRKFLLLCGVMLLSSAAAVAQIATSGWANRSLLRRSVLILLVGLALFAGMNAETALGHGLTLFANFQIGRSTPSVSATVICT